MPLKITNAVYFPIVLFVIAIFSTQLGASVASKFLFAQIGTEGAAALRYIISAIILSVIFKPWRMRIPRDAWATIIFYGLSLGFMGFFLYLSIKRIPMGIAVGLEILGPLGMAICGSRRFSDFIWVAFAATGVWLLLPHTESTTALDPYGILFALIASAFWVSYAYFGRKVGSLHGARTVALGTAISSLIFFPVGLYQVGSALFAPGILFFALMVAVLSTAIPFTLELITLSRLPLKVYGTLTSLEPGIAAFIGMLVLNEHLDWGQWLALVCICVASAGTTISIKKEEPDS